MIERYEVQYIPFNWSEPLSRTVPVADFPDEDVAVDRLLEETYDIYGEPLEIRLGARILWENRSYR